LEASLEKEEAELEKIQDSLKGRSTSLHAIVEQDLIFIASPRQNSGIPRSNRNQAE